METIACINTKVRLLEAVIGIDIGTSGIRAQAIERDGSKTLSTSITLRHPLPGSNVMDHLDFCINNGVLVAQRIIINAIEMILDSLEINLEDVVRIAVCGNPIQLSIFQGMEVRDLAYAGDAALERFGISRKERPVRQTYSSEIGLKVFKREVEIWIPPAVAHMIGADAIAMLYKSGALENRKTCLVTDYGTNAEIALLHKGEIYTGSAAAGPAIEGQQIEKGILASPGAISDVNISDDKLCVTVLDEEMIGKKAYLTDGKSNYIEKLDEYVRPVGITGTGTIATVYIGLKTGLIKLPRITTPDRTIKLYSDEITFGEKDLEEASKAFGAFRAGHITLVNHIGIGLGDVEVAYMAGAGGTYADPIKAQGVGLVPPQVKEIYQVGNTSLAFACDIAKNLEVLEKAKEIAEILKKTHVMFALEKDFKNAYIAELGYWQGMPLNLYNAFLKRYGLPEIQDKPTVPEIHRIVCRDIPIFGEKGLHIVREIGTILQAKFEGCTGCKSCEKACLEKAIKVVKENGDFKAIVKTELCDGIACRKCESACIRSVFDYSKLTTDQSK